MNSRTTAVPAIATATGLSAAAALASNLVSGTSAADTLSGTAGADEIFGLGNNDLIDGADGNDTIWGGSGNDTLGGGAGDDLLIGEGGDDRLDGALDSDTYRVTGTATAGFGGYDTYADSGTTGVDRLVVAGTATGAVDIGIKGWNATGIEQIDATGTTGVVRLLDTNDANLIDLRTTTLIGSNLVIDGAYGNDTIYGSVAADTIVGAGGNDVMDGGDGGDTYRITGNEAGGWSSFHNFDSYADTGTAGIDKIVALGAGDVDIGLLGSFGPASGIEVIDATGATGTVRLYGDGSHSTLDFRAVTVVGTNVVIDGNYGNDTVYGSAGADTILAGWGDDVFDGAGGGDTYRVIGNTTTAFQGYDSYKDSGASGIDKVVAVGADVDIGAKGWSATGIEVIDTTGATGAVRLVGTNGAELFDLRETTLVGSNLVLDAGWGNDTLYGSGGNDTIANNQGDDMLDGAGGSDTIRVSGNLVAGFQGYDTYADSGGSGTDRIVAQGAGDVDIGTRGWSGTGIETIDATGAAGTVRLISTNAADVFDLRTTTLVGSNLVLDAGWGNDTVYGSVGSDTIANNQGDDVLDGADGGDVFRVSGNTALNFQGYDLYRDSGMTGTDKVVVAGGTLAVDIGLKGWSATGVEQIDATGTTGVVRLLDTGDANLLDFRTTTLTGSNLVIDANYGNDTVYGSAAADTIVGASGNDLLDGGGSGDLYRVTGTEAGGWSSFHGFDSYADTGSAGIDKIVALGTGDVDIGLLGNFGVASGIEVIDGTGATGTVRLYGDGSATTLDFRAVTVLGTKVVIDSNYGNDTVYGTAGADTLLASFGDDVLDGAGGGDTYRVTGKTGAAYQGYDTYMDSGTSGIDKIVALGTGDVDIGLLGSFGAANGIEAIDATGATGTVRLLGDHTATTLDFRSVALTGTRILIDAGNGNDVVYGSAAADTLVSNNGEDTVDGAGGADTYRVSGNEAAGFHGYDTYRDSGTSGADKIVVSGGTVAVDIGIKGWNATGIEQIDATGTTGVVRLLDTGDANLIDLRATTLTGSNLVIDARYGNDTVYGSVAADTILAGGGNDVLNGGMGGDTYRVTGNEAGGWSSFHGFDTYADSGTSGTDKIVALGTGDVDIGFKGSFGPTSGIEVIDATGATGTVRLLGESGAQTLDFRGVTLTGARIVIDAGNGNDVVYGSAGADTLLSHNGDDTLDGAGGSDAYRVTGNAASGFHGRDTYKDSGTTGTDTLFAIGSGNVDIGVHDWQSTGIEVIDGTGATGTVRVWADDSANLLDFGMATFVGGNVLIDGAYGNDTIKGSAGADQINGGADADLLDGQNGADIYRVTGNRAAGWASFQGYDTYADTGVSGIDKIVALGAGDVDIGVAGWKNTGIEVVDATGATGAVRLLGRDAADQMDFRSTTLTGANLVIDGGYGNDTMFGSAAADTMVGGGNDDLLDGADGGDTFRVTGNVAGGWSSFQGYDTYADTGTSGTDTILALGAGDVDIGMLSFDAANGIEVIDTTGVVGQTRIIGSWSDDMLDFSATRILGSRVVIDGGGGTDAIFGSTGSDTIIGGNGADSMAGGAGNDVYLVGRGSGMDVIWDYDETAGNLDTVEFGATIAIDQLWFKRVDGYLEVRVIGSWDRVYLMDWDTGPASQVEQFRTADGHVLLNTSVDVLVDAMAVFDAPSGGITTLPDTYREALLPVITNAWS